MISQGPAAYVRCCDRQHEDPTNEQGPMMPTADQQQEGPNPSHCSCAVVVAY